MSEDFAPVKKREHYIDIAKGIAMVLVIIGHCEFAPSQLKWWLYSFHMPLFFLLSGLVFNPVKYKKFTQFLKAKAQSLLVPYFLMSLFLWVWKDIIGHKTTFLTDEDTLNDFIGIFLGHRGTPYYFSMWFLTAIFAAEVILYFISRISGDRLWALCLTVVLFSLLSWFILENIDDGFYWSLDLTPIAVSFIALGYIVKLYKDKIRLLFNPAFFVLAAALNVTFAYLNHRVCGRADLYYTKMGNYFYYMLAAVAGSWAVIIFCKFIKKMPVLEYIGRNSIVYYAFQNAVFIGGAEKIVQELSSLGGIFDNRIFMLILAVTLSCIGLAVWSEAITKCFPILLGKPKHTLKNRKQKL